MKTISEVDFVPSKADRAKSFNVKFRGGSFASDKEFSTFSNFYPFEDLTMLGVQIPQNEFGDKPQFVLESLPSKDKQLFYNEVAKWRDKTSFTDPFDVVIDVISGDGFFVWLRLYGATEAFFEEY